MLLQRSASETTLRGIGKRLGATFEQHTEREYCSGMIGLSARPVIAALLAKRDARFLPTLHDVVARWTRYLDRPSLESDLMWGTTGALLCATELETLSPGVVPPALVRALCMQTTAATRAELQRARKKEPVYLGLSHGLAGYLLALESSHAVFGTALPHSLREQLLAVLEEEQYQAPGGGALWPATVGGDPIGIHGWCHGAPGIALACLVGYSLTRRPTYRALAKKGLAATADFPSSHHSFCCGSIGRAQVLIEGFRVLGSEAYLPAAKKALLDAQERVSRKGNIAHAFHQGTNGMKYLRQRLQNTRLPLLGLGPLSVAS